MPVPKRVAAINDLSGFGRCSLTAAIRSSPPWACRSARCRRQCSARTRLSHLHLRRTVTENMREVIAAGWDRLGVRFGRGLLRFPGQRRTDRHCARLLPRPPGGAAHCRPSWATTAQSTRRIRPICARMRTRCAEAADCITPNLTEACILLGAPYTQAADSARYARICARPVRARPALCRHHGHTPGVTASSTRTRRTANSLSTATRACPPTAAARAIYSPVVTGALLSGRGFADAVHAPRAVLCPMRSAIRRRSAKTFENGVIFEPILGGLATCEKT